MPGKAQVQVVPPDRMRIENAREVGRPGPGPQCGRRHLGARIRLRSWQTVVDRPIPPPLGCRTANTTRWEVRVRLVLGAKAAVVVVATLARFPAQRHAAVAFGSRRRPRTTVQSRMAWFTNRRKLTHTTSYSDRTKAAEDAQKAAGHGWRVDAEEESEGPLRDPNWVAGGAFGTVLAGTRPAKQIVVTYVRTDDWLASHQQA